MQHLKEGDRVLVSAHGNSLRSIIMSLEDLSEEAVVNLELATGVPIVYNIDTAGKAIDKLILH
jgi:2,3-bisphosphoglycerate-dependent phosphoglycerate mutase